MNRTVELCNKWWEFIDKDKLYYGEGYLADKGKNHFETGLFTTPRNAADFFFLNVKPSFRQRAFCYVHSFPGNEIEYGVEYWQIKRRPRKMMEEYSPYLPLPYEIKLLIHKI